MKNILKKTYDILRSRKTWLVLLMLSFIFIDAHKITADTISAATPELPNPMLYGNPIGGLISGVGEFFTSVLLKLPTALAMMIAQFGGFVISLEGKLLSWVIDLGSFTNLGVVQQGWRICRDFANLFFIAILIYIAFATILRLQKGDPKKLLFKVIVMAIIINFSLMIGGIIIDFSQVLFKYFIFAPLANGSKDGFHFSETLMNAVGVQKMLVTNASLDAGSVLLRLLFVIVFTFLCVIVFGAIVLMLFVRNFWLWILLILSPLAWFLGIVPVPILSKYSGEWWKNFIKWCFIAPIMGFFIFLSIGILGSNKDGATDELMKPLAKIEQQYTPGGKTDNSVISFSERVDSIFHPKTLIRFFITLAFLVGGLMAGQSLGSGAAKGALKMLGDAKKNSQKWMGRKAMQTKPVQAVGNKLMQWGNAPIIGGVFKRAGMATQRGTTGARGEDLKNAEKRIKYMNDDQLKKNFNSFNDWEKQAAAKKLGFDKLSQEQFEAMQKVYSKQGYEKEKKDLEKAHPYWTDDFKKSAEKIKIEVEFKGAEAEFNKVKESGKNADSTEYKNAETKYKSAEAKYTANKKDIEDAKANVADKFKEFDVSKMSVNFDRPAFNDPNSAEFNTLAVALAEKPFKDGIGKAIQKILIKKDGRVDGQKTAAIRRDLVMKAAGHIYTSNGMGSEGLEAVEKFCKKPLSGSPSAHVGGYTHKDVNKYLEKEFGAKLEETSEKNTKTIKRQAGFTPQGFTIEGNSVISPEPEKKSSSGSSSEVNDEEDEEEEVVEEKKEGEVSGEEKGGSEETEENKEGKSEEKK